MLVLREIFKLSMRTSKNLFNRLRNLSPYDGQFHPSFFRLWDFFGHCRGRIDEILNVFLPMLDDGRGQQNPIHSVKSWNVALLFPPDTADSLPEPFHGLTRLLPHLRFCFREHPEGGRPCPLSLLLQLDSSPYLWCPPSGLGVTCHDWHLPPCSYSSVWLPPQWRNKTGFTFKHWSAAMCILMPCAFIDKPCVAQKFKKRTPLGFRSGRPFLSVTPPPGHDVTMPTWVLAWVSQQNNGISPWPLAATQSRMHQILTASLAGGGSNGQRPGFRVGGLYP